MIAALQEYDWPGNVRELQNVIARMVALTSSGRITLADLPPAILRAPAGRPAGAPTVARARPVPAAESDPAMAEERTQLLALIGSVSTMREAAARLGVTRSTLYRRLERCGLQPRRTFGVN